MTTTATARYEECGEAISADVDGAYEDLYGPYYWDAHGLEREIRRLVEERPTMEAGYLLLLAMACWRGYDPEALVDAVRHRLAEEGAA